MLFVLHIAERVVIRKVGTFFRVFFHIIYLYYPPNHLTHSHAVGVGKIVSLGELCSAHVPLHECYALLLDCMGRC
jgi:hypothetical protein